MYAISMAGSNVDAAEMAVSDQQKVINGLASDLKEIENCLSSIENDVAGMGATRDDS